MSNRKPDTKVKIDEAYEDQIMHAAELIKNADAVIIGAGAVRGCNCSAMPTRGGKNNHECLVAFWSDLRRLMD